MKQPYPYEHAPRLAAQGDIPVCSLSEQQQGDLEIEIGPGRGAFLLERVRERPDARLIGLEIRWKWATLVDERLHKLGLGPHARVYAEDARLLLPRLQPDASVAAFFIHFPDPWWKSRQRKRLVVGKPLLDQMARLLRPSGMLFVQTDVTERGEVYETLIDAHEAFAQDGDQPGSARISACPWSARGNREKRAEQDGIPVVRLRYRRKG
ncbi:MAG: tRNA (guanine-N7)-methyltransferase [Deltaproteobacteria bacterium]|nr:tRNA (guanine-N7)-methyltransferase [Deltaproteobacteria bacterium]